MHSFAVPLLFSSIFNNISRRFPCLLVIFLVTALCSKLNSGCIFSSDYYYGYRKNELNSHFILPLSLFLSLQTNRVGPDQKGRGLQSTSNL